MINIHRWKYEKLSVPRDRFLDATNAFAPQCTSSSFMFQCASTNSVPGNLIPIGLLVPRSFSMHRSVQTSETRSHSFWIRYNDLLSEHSHSSTGNTHPRHCWCVISVTPGKRTTTCVKLCSNLHSPFPRLIKEAGGVMK